VVIIKRDRSRSSPELCGVAVCRFRAEVIQLAAARGMRFHFM